MLSTATDRALLFDFHPNRKAPPSRREGGADNAHYKKTLR